MTIHDVAAANSRSMEPQQSKNRKALVHRRIVSMRAVVVLVVATGAAVAHAQYDAGATLDLGMGYGQGALSQSAMEINARETRRRAGIEDADRAESDYAGSGMTRAERLEALREEYLRRVRSDGSASADAWAFEMGRRDAMAARD